MMDSDSDQEYMDDLDSDLDADFVLNSQKYEYECEGSHPKDYKVLVLLLCYATHYNLIIVYRF